jgi:hypothetical protein
MALPMTIEYKGTEWWVIEDCLIHIKDKTFITFDDLSEEELDYIYNQMQERGDEVEAIKDNILNAGERVEVRSNKKNWSITQ